MKKRPHSSSNEGKNKKAQQEHHFISLPNLPVYTDYCLFTGQEFRYWDHYDMQACRTLMMLDLPFESRMRAGYPTLVIDCEYGQLYVKQTCRQVVNHFLKTHTCGGKAFQDTIYDCLGIKYRHVIALGHAAYFSLRGHTRYNTSWIGLHFFTCYQTFHTEELDYLLLESQQIKGKTYHVSIELPCKISDFEGYMTDSLKVNQTIQYAIDQHFHSFLGWDFRFTQKLSILTNEEYQLSPQQIPQLSFLKIARMTLRRMIFPRHQELSRVVREERYEDFDTLLGKALRKILRGSGLD